MGREWIQGQRKVEMHGEESKVFASFIFRGTLLTRTIQFKGFSR